MQHNSYKNLATSLLLLLCVCLAISGCDSESNAETTSELSSAQAAVPNPAKKIIKVEVLEVKPRAIRDILILPGETEASQDVVLSAERGGRVEWVGPSDGDAVVKGQEIIKIDQEALEAKMNRAQATHDLKLKLAERRISLFDSKVLSKEELDEAQTFLRQAESDLRTARVNFEQGIVRSPINGVINELHVDPGEYIDTGKPVADIVNVKKIRINVNVPEMDVRYLQKGHETRVTVDAYGDALWKGKVGFVAFKADSATKTFKVRVVVDNSDNRIRPGMIARVLFLKRVIPDAITAPLFAIVDKGGERVVFVENNGVAQARPIELGVIEGDVVQITKGLKLGDMLIVTGQTEVEDGVRVSSK